MRLHNVYRILAILLPVATLAVGVLSWSAPKESDSLGPLCQDVVGVKDSSTAPVAFAARVASPYTYKFDTKFQPSLPFRIKFFYYSSPGEVDIKAAGDLIARWEAAQAFPGNPLSVSIRAEGDGSESHWKSDGGLRFGARYRYNVNIGWTSFKKEDYVPKIPHFDISWPCTTTFSTFALSSPPAPYEACANYWGRGELPCFLKVRTVDATYWPGSCDFPGGWDPEVDFNWCSDPDTAGLDTMGFWAYIRANPSVKFGFGANLGACAVLSLEGDSIVDSQSGGFIREDGGSIHVDAKIPCDFAKATEGQRVFHFTQGPFSYHADLLFQLVGKLEPVIKPCFVELLEVSLSAGAAICGLIVPNAALSLSFSLPFSDMDATFSVPITDPIVCNIKPAPPDTVMALSTTEITWNTSWGAPDSCDCKVRLWYHSRVSPSPWSPWAQIDTVRLNTGKYNWLVLFDLIGQEAQIRVDFLDPDKDSLHTDSSGIFRIVPPSGLDYGDAPDPYPTMLDSNGARHFIVPGVFLGVAIDPDSDGQPDSHALGDDNNDGTDDEDGVVFTTCLVPGYPAMAEITASVTGFIDAWIDFNHDGDWDDAGEKIFNSTGVGPGVDTLSFDVPPTAPLGVTISRFRFSTSGALGDTGLASDGEVEDYEVTIVEPKCGDVNNNGTVDLGDGVYLINYQFKGGPAPVPSLCVGDVNNDDVVGLGDVVYLIAYQFRFGPAPNSNCCHPPWK
jgi:hypothetical protein